MRGLPTSVHNTFLIIDVRTGLILNSYRYLTIEIMDDDTSSVGNDSFWDLNSQTSHLMKQGTDDWDTKSETSGASNAFSAMASEVHLNLLT